MTIKQYLRSLPLVGDAVAALGRRSGRELSHEYLEANQRKIDSELGEGRTFKTVKRASW